MKHTNVYIVCDLSASMAGTKEEKLRAMVRDMVSLLATEETRGDQSFHVTLVPFAARVEMRPSYTASALPKHELTALHYQNGDWNLGGATALKDAIGAALAKADQSAVTLVSVFSDGEENASYQWSSARLRGLIEQFERTGNLTLTFAGPASARAMLGGIGVPAENFRPWDGSDAELTEVARDTASAVSTYIKDRSVGQTRSVRFYADVTKVSDAGIRAMTKEVQPSEVRTVTRHMAGRAIADFYGKHFQTGHHYYELIKPEYLQDDKDLVVHIKDRNEYRQGSRAVRSLLGLPETGRIRVAPGPHSDKYRLFVQSASLNRKVVEGQTMLTLA